MRCAPDVAGIYAALARLPERAPEQRRADRAAAATTRTATAMHAGRRYRTRELPTLHRARRVQPRDALGRFVSMKDAA